MRTPMSRRTFMTRTALAAGAGLTAPLWTRRARAIAPGPFEPTWESLAENYQCPEWFRDAKFGIWAHWSAQCVPEQGDWYARNMYIQGDTALRLPRQAPTATRPSSASWRSTTSGTRSTGTRRS